MKRGSVYIGTIYINDKEILMHDSFLMMVTCQQCVNFLRFLSWLVATGSFYFLSMPLSAVFQLLLNWVPPSIKATFFLNLCAIDHKKQKNIESLNLTNYLLWWLRSVSLQEQPPVALVIALIFLEYKLL